MQNRLLLLVTIFLYFVLLFISSRNTTFFNDKQDIIIKDSNTNEISKMNLEEYVVGVVAAEMPASFSIEALKAQAIASRTYAVYKIRNSTKNYDVVTDVSNQSYIDVEKMKTKWKEDFEKYYAKIKKAVNDTSGLILTYNNKVIEAFYFAMSNGFTEDASLVFNEDRDYLKSVESKYEDESLKNFRVEKEFDKKEFCNKLEISCNMISITNFNRSKTGRVNYIDINGITYKGTEFRKKLALRSTDFDIKYNNDKVIVITKGYGHGVGMSQYGANGMAKAGFNYDDILKYFYKNIEINSI